MRTQQYNNNLDKLLAFTKDLKESCIFKEIEDTDGRYFISNKGQVLSLCGSQARILKPFSCGNGYLYVRINGKNKRIHRLVGQAFLNNADNLPVIHHKDNNKKNNNVDNIQWVSYKENCLEYQKYIKKKYGEV